MENERADAERDGRTSCFARHTKFSVTNGNRGLFFHPVSVLTASRVDNPYPINAQSAEHDDC